MILAFIVTLDINNPVKAPPSDDLREEYRENLERAIWHRLDNHGFDGHLIEVLGTSVNEYTVTPMDIP